ncbi:bone morphogenetic protein 2-like [Athalia rosae]|uniref:bone morphogenetic protein 2-like n=1 Tax=Athalia rosae TaxID=37344 RepID=UPI0020337B9E|nr:bone morphogenetic protein 2-like [Athalia rosae]
MLRRRVFFMLLLFAVVLAHPVTESPAEGSGSSVIEFSEDFTEDEIQDDAGQREAALTKLQQIFGIPEPSERSNRHKIPPQFMMELYNTIADPSGVTRGKNPYNAKVVRSFIERDSSMAHYYLFNISGLEMNESVLEAELHLYRKRTPLKAMHPAVLSSPYYLIRVYQVLDQHQLDTPDLHRLLNVHYVGAHASGWQVFNVKQAVLSWVSGTPNLGLLVTASNIFDDEAVVHFSRRNDYHHSKQPILVLFDDDGKDRPLGENIVPHYYKYANDLDEEEEEDEDGGNEDEDEFEKADYGIRKQLARVNKDIGSRGRRDASSSKKATRRIVSTTPNVSGALSSMDIYTRAVMRKRLARRKNTSANRNEQFLANDSTLGRRTSRSAPTEFSSNSTSEVNVTECARHELYVDFEEIGWSDFVIAPKGYSAYHCKGHCNFPLSQGQHPTNHATVQSIVHMLRQGKEVNEPCCVPTKLLSSSILYFDDGDNVVLKLYEDMVADRCGCH